MAGILKEVPIGDLYLSMTESQMARRDAFDAALISELAESIKRQGILQPIIVRLQPASKSGSRDRLTIVAGERRYLAAEQAGLKTIPALVREMTDDDVIEVQLIENLQRLDLDPIQEAEGYNELHGRYNVPIDEIHARVGKSRAYVYNRLKLLTLCKEARQALNKGEILLSVALLIARIPDEKTQKEALHHITINSMHGDLCSKASALEIIEEDFMLRLKDAPFPTDDEDLVPSATACGRCPKRTGNQPELFGDVKEKDTCTDRVCYQSKIKAMSKRRIREAKAEGKKVIQGRQAKKVFPYSHSSAEGGYVEAGLYQHDIGDTPLRALGKKALSELPTTLVVNPHTDLAVELYDRSQVAKAVKAKRKAEGKSPQTEKREDPEAAARRKVKVERAYRLELWRQAREARPMAPLRDIVAALADRLEHDCKKSLCAMIGLDPVISRRYGMEYKDYAKALEKYVGGIAHDGGELQAFALDCIIAREVQVQTWSTDSPMPNLKKTAQGLGIDLRRVRASVRPKKPKAKAKAKAPAKKKAAAKKKPKR